MGGPAERAGEPTPVEQVVGAGAVKEMVDDSDDGADGQAASEHDERERPDFWHDLGKI